jgi:hypothetical protein
MMVENVVSFEEAATRIGCSKAHLFRLCEAGELRRAYSGPGMLRAEGVSPESIDDLIAKRQKQRGEE